MEATKQVTTAGHSERLQLPAVSNNVLGEARMVLPGIQALSGFQLVAVFNNRFESLDHSLQVLHFGALCLTVIATALIMAPAAYDRMTDPYEVSDKFIRLSSATIALGMIPLLVSLSLDIFVIGQMVFHNEIVSSLVATGLACFMSILWFLVPKGVSKE